MLVETFLSDMRKTGHPPDGATYSALLKGACCRAPTLGEPATPRRLPKCCIVQTAVNLFYQAREEQVILDEACYNSLVHTLCRASRLKEVEEVHCEMKLRKATPLSAASYAMIAKARGEAKDLPGAFKAMEDMRASGVKPNLYTYTCLAQACCHNAAPSKGLEVFEQMKKEGIRPDDVAYATVINGMILAGRCDEALGLCNEALGQARGVPLPIQLEKVAKALQSTLARKGDSKKAKELEALVKASTNAGGASIRWSSLAAPTK